MPFFTKLAGSISDLTFKS